MSFYRSLKLGQRFSVHTKVIAWDERYCLMTQDFYAQGQLIASGVVKARFLKRTGGSVPMQQLLALGQVNTPSPQPATWIVNWSAVHDEFLARRQ
jgi:hypothetical protein